MDMAKTAFGWILRFAWKIIKTVGGFFLFKLGGYWLIINSFLTSFLWSAQFENEMGENNMLLNTFYDVSIVVVTLFCLAMFFYRVFRYFKRRKDPTWGILANKKNNSISKKENKILDPNIPEILLHDEKIGTFFGEKDGKYVCQPENVDGMALILGGPGSMKSTSVILQTMRSWGAKDSNEPEAWKHTMFVIDIKKELEKIGLTAEQRERTKVFNPENEFSYGYDPFFLAKSRTRQDEVLQDMNDIAWAIIPESHAKDPFWDNAARDILIGVLLYGFRVKKIGFIQTLEWLADHTSRKALAEIASCGDDECRRQVLEFLDAPDVTLGSIWTSLQRPIKVFYQDGMIKNALRKEGADAISPQDLEEGINIIFQVPEPKLLQWKSILTLAINQFMNYFYTRDEINRDLKNETILFMIDETPRMGKLNLREGLSTLRSKGIHIVLCAQGLPQFRTIYGKDETDSIISSISLIACLSATDVDSQKWLSSLGGQYDKTMISRSTNQRDLAAFGGRGTSYSEQLRNIIPPETFGNLPNTGQLILYNPFGKIPFCRVNKIPWFKDNTWVREEVKTLTSE